MVMRNFADRPTQVLEGRRSLTTTLDKTVGNDFRVSGRRPLRPIDKEGMR